MTTLTVPKNFIKNDDLVILPRKLYESLLRSQNGHLTTIKRSSSFRVKKGQERFYNKLDKKLTKIVRDVKKGKVVGPFDNTKDLMKSLKS